MDFCPLVMPSTGKKVFATGDHYTMREGEIVGEVVAVNGAIIKYRDRDGDSVSIIWKFKDGYNKTIYFGD